MSTKVADMTVEELRATIREVIEEVLVEEEMLSDEFAADLKARMDAPDWIEAETVWGKR